MARGDVASVKLHMTEHMEQARDRLVSQLKGSEEVAGK